MKRAGSIPTEVNSIGSHLHKKRRIDIEGSRNDNTSLSSISLNRIPDDIIEVQHSDYLQRLEKELKNPFQRREAVTELLKYKSELPNTILNLVRELLISGQGTDQKTAVVLTTILENAAKKERRALSAVTYSYLDKRPSLSVHNERRTSGGSFNQQSSIEEELKNPFCRQAAVIRLLEYGKNKLSADILELIGQLLTDQSTDSETATACAEILAKAARNEQELSYLAIEQLGQALLCDNLQLKCNASAALENISRYQKSELPKSVCLQLNTLLNDNHTEPTTRLNCAWALAYTAENGQELPKLILCTLANVLSEKDQDLKKAALYTLNYIPKDKKQKLPEELIDSLVYILNNSNGEVLGSVAEILRDVLYDNQLRHSTIIPALTDGLVDTLQSTRSHVAGLLGDIISKSRKSKVLRHCEINHTLNLLTSLLRDQATSENASYALKNIAQKKIMLPENSIHELSKILNNYPLSETRYNAGLALRYAARNKQAELLNPIIINSLEQALTDNNNKIRKNAALAFSYIPRINPLSLSSQVVVSLIGTLEDRKEISNHAAKALINIIEQEQTLPIQALLKLQKALESRGVNCKREYKQKLRNLTGKNQQISSTVEEMQLELQEKEDPANSTIIVQLTKVRALDRRQLSKEIKAKLQSFNNSKIDAEYVLSIILSRKYFNPEIINNYPAKLWCREALCSDLIARMGSITKEEMFELYSALFAFEESKGCGLYNQERDNILITLINKFSKSVSYSPSNVSEALFLLKEIKNYKVVLDSNSKDWRFELRATWLDNKLKAYQPRLQVMQEDSTTIAKTLWSEDRFLNLYTIERLLLKAKFSSDEEIIFLLEFLQKGGVTDLALNEVLNQQNTHKISGNDLQQNLVPKIIALKLENIWSGKDYSKIVLAKERLMYLYAANWNFEEITDLLDHLHAKNQADLKKLDNFI